jgi:hypothetical protein
LRLLLRHAPGLSVENTAKPRKHDQFGAHKTRLIACCQPKAVNLDATFESRYQYGLLSMNADAEVVSDTAWELIRNASSATPGVTSTHALRRAVRGCREY